MYEFVIIVIGFLLVVLMAFALERLYREVFFFEGIRFGGRIHRWLYDRWARTYDRDKYKVQKNDDQNLVNPLISKLSLSSTIGPDTLVLDIATGTGRFPDALLGNTQFAGRVIGLDISRGMLKQANIKLSKYGNRAVLLNQQALTLPFPDSTFDVVSCLETIELLPDTHAHLSEFHRVMQPGGILLISRNTGEWGIRGKVCPADIFSSQLSAAGFEQVEITPWWKWFDLVWARKPGGGIKNCHPRNSHRRIHESMFLFVQQGSNFFQQILYQNRLLQEFLTTIMNALFLHSELVRSVLYRH